MSANNSNIKSVLLFVTLLGAGFFVGEGISYAKNYFAAQEDIAPVKIADTSAHFATTDKPIIVYATQWCPHCKRAKKYLNENNIAHEVRDVEVGDPAHKQMFDSLDTPGIPIILIGEKVFSGFDQSLIDTELKERGII